MSLFKFSEPVTLPSTFRAAKYQYHGRRHLPGVYCSKEKGGCGERWAMNNWTITTLQVPDDLTTSFQVEWEDFVSIVDSVLILNNGIDRNFVYPGTGFGKIDIDILSFPNLIQRIDLYWLVRAEFIEFLLRNNITGWDIVDLNPKRNDVFELKIVGCGQNPVFVDGISLKSRCERCGLTRYHPNTILKVEEGVITEDIFRFFPPNHSYIYANKKFYEAVKQQDFERYLNLDLNAC